MDLGRHECRSMIGAQANHFVQSSELKIMQNNNNENVNGNSGAHATRSAAANSDYDDGDNVEMNAGELSGNLTDSCGSEKMNLSEGKVSGQAEDKDKVSGKSSSLTLLMGHMACFPRLYFSESFNDIFCSFFFSGPSCWHIFSTKFGQ